MTHSARCSVCGDTSTQHRVLLAAEVTPIRTAAPFLARILLVLGLHEGAALTTDGRVVLHNDGSGRQQQQHLKKCGIKSLMRMSATVS